MATQPNKGPVGATLTVNNPPGMKGTAAYKGRYKNGLWRSNKPFIAGFGVQIVMRHEKNITKGDVLRVPFRFQTPALNSLARDYQHNWSTYDTLRMGQKTDPMGRQLLQLSVDTLWMTRDTALATTGVMVWDGANDPQRVLDELRWIEGYTPGSQPQNFRLVLSQPQIYGNHAIVNMLAHLTGVQATTQPGEAGAEYLTLAFEEFSSNETIQRKQRPQQAGKSTHKVGPTETMYGIATRSHFHAPSAWSKIAKANGMTGVSPSSYQSLQAWLKKHHKTSITIPAK